METNPDSAFFRYAKRAYFVIDKEGIIRYKHVMDKPGHMLDPQEILDATAQAIKAT